MSLVSCQSSSRRTSADQRSASTPPVQVLGRQRFGTELAAQSDVAAGDRHRRPSALATCSNSRQVRPVPTTCRLSRFCRAEGFRDASTKSSCAEPGDDVDSWRDAYARAAFGVTGSDIRTVDSSQSRQFDDEPRRCESIVGLLASISASRTRWTTRQPMLLRYRDCFRVRIADAPAVHLTFSHRLATLSTMPDIQAFRGIRYDLGHVGSLSDVIAPPYDVIDAELQTAALQEASGQRRAADPQRDEPGDDEHNNRYTRAARLPAELAARGRAVHRGRSGALRLSPGVHRRRRRRTRGAASCAACGSSGSAKARSIRTKRRMAAPRPTG